MARELAWSPEALEDIESIAKFIARDSTWYAKIVVGKFVEVANSCLEFPEIGRVVPELGDATIRERFVFSYRIIFQIRPAQIRVLAVIHGKRKLDELP
jgi:toxin ParE1/3/4